MPELNCDSDPGTANTLAAEHTEAILVSVIIPALNEEEMIGKCLASLAAADFARNRFEVIVMDNGSTDRTVAIARSFADRLTLTVLERPQVTVSTLRNMGAMAARGNILAFLDADCLVPPTWLADVERNLLAEEAGVVGGYIRIPDDSGWVSQAWYGVGYAPKDGDVGYVPSGNLLVSRASFLQIGGFNNELKTAEDFDLCVRARQAGFTVRAVTALAVVHLRTPNTLREFYLRERWHGAHVARAFFANRQQWKKFRAIAFTLYVLACTVAAALSLGFGLLTRQFIPLLFCLTALIAGAAVCSLVKLRSARPRNFVVNWVQLTVLHVVYGLARARALLSQRTRYARTESTAPTGSVGVEGL